MQDNSMVNYIFSEFIDQSNEIQLNDNYNNEAGENNDVGNISVLDENSARELTTVSNEISIPRIRGTYNKISDDTRHRIISAFQKSENISEIASYESLPINTVKSIIKKFEMTGNMHKGAKGGPNHCLVTQEHKNFISSEVDKKSNVTCKMLQKLVFDKYGVKYGITTIHDNLVRLDYTLKLLTPIPEKRNDDQTIESRRIYAREFLRIEEEYPDKNVFFLDEVGFNLSMKRRLGRSVIGTPANLTVKQIRSKNISLCCCFNKESLFYYDVNIKPYNNESFLGHINAFFNFLLDKSLGPCVIIMDNVRFHKHINVSTRFAEMGHKLVFLPVYSPFLNPIENFFSKWKSLVHSSTFSNQDELIRNMTSCLSQFTNSDFDGYYRNMKRFINLSLDGQPIE